MTTIATIKNTDLVSSELPSTTWPCQLVHVKGQTAGTQGGTRSFIQALHTLRNHSYASKMQKLQCPTASIFDAMVDGVEARIQPSDGASYETSTENGGVSTSPRGKKSFLSLKKQERATDSGQELPALGWSCSSSTSAVFAY